MLCDSKGFLRLIGKGRAQKVYESKEKITILFILVPQFEGMMMMIMFQLRL